MRKRLFIVLALMVCGFAGAWAEEVTPEQAREIAQTFMKSHGSRRAAPEMEQPVKVSGLYIFNINNNGGYVIVSNDDQTTPILGFSDSGSIDPDNMPSNMRAWLQGYADEIAWLQKNQSNGAIVTPAADKARRRALADHNPIGPLLTTTWNQRAPYNNLCPEYDGTNRAVTGCVATAMAQVMKFHAWPQSPTEDIPGYTTDSYKLKLDGLTSSITFDWDNMKNSYSGTTTSAQQTAVAQLMQYCGYSVEMDYGPSSSSNTANVAQALKSYFDYNSTTTYVSRSYYTNAKWINLIYHELENGRPVVYGGQSSGGGHEFVCDGYKYENETDYFHINWGWGGKSDEYYVLSVLNPYAGQGAGGSSSNDGFHYGQDAVIGIQPRTSNGTIADITPNVVNLNANSMTLSNNTVGVGVQVKITLNITNNSSDDYEGDIYIGRKESSGSSLLEGDFFTISGQQAENCVINYTPTKEGTYNLVFFWPGDDGFYYTDNIIMATLNVVASVVPTDFNVNYTGGQTAAVSWTSPSSATTFDLDVNGTLKEDVTSPYPLNGLEYGMSYSVKVRAKVDDVLHRWTNATTFNTYRVVNYVLNDSYGDGWQGSAHSANSAILVVDENENVVENLTVSDGLSSSSGTLHLTGSYYQFIWQEGGYDGECSWSFTDENNNILFGGTGGTQKDGEVLYTIGTIAYSKPKNLVANDVTSTSASIAWTGKDYATSYNLRYRNGLLYDFESATPWAVDEFAPFTTYDGDGLPTYGISDVSFKNSGYTGSVIAFQNGVASDFTAHSGNAFGCFMDARTNNNDWFITPEVKISEGDVFSFWARSYTDNYGLERFKVGIYGSTDGEFESYLAGETDAVEAPTTWTLYSYDLSAYAGQTIKLAINCVSNDAFAFFIDDIFVGNPNDINSTWISSNTNVTSPYVLKGLTDETYYEVQVQAVYSERLSDWSESVFFTTFKDVVLADKATDNSSVVETYDEKKVCVTLTNRTLYKDGAWNTICLPFNVTDGDPNDNVSFSGTPLEGAVVMELDVEKGSYEHQTSLSNGTLYLNFKPANSIVAGTPYLIKWPIDNEHPTIVSPVFSDVTISKDMHNVSFSGGSFCGNYNYLQFGSEDTSILLIGINDQGKSALYYPKPDTTNPENPIYPSLGACRSYFFIGPDPGSNFIRSYVLNFGDDDNATGIIAIGDSQLSTLNSPLSGWYTLDGRRLASKPTAKGIYLHEGRKVVIK